MGDGDAATTGCPVTSCSGFQLSCQQHKRNKLEKQRQKKAICTAICSANSRMYVLDKIVLIKYMQGSSRLSRPTPSADNVVGWSGQKMPELNLSVSIRRVGRCALCSMYICLVVFAVD